MKNFSHWFAANRVGVVFCGRQSPGGHNVIWGLHDALKVHNPNSILFGFLGKLFLRISICLFNVFLIMHFDDMYSRAV